MRSAVSHWSTLSPAYFGADQSEGESHPILLGETGQRQSGRSQCGSISIYCAMLCYVMPYPLAKHLSTHSRAKEPTIIFYPGASRTLACKYAASVRGRRLTH